MLYNPDMTRISVGILIAVLVAGMGSYVAQRHGSNQLSRIDMLYAMTVEGRFAIDTLKSNTMDSVNFGGRQYSDKPPGMTYLALPSYALTVGAQHRFGLRGPATPRGVTLTLRTTSIATSVLLSALGAMATWALLSAYARKPRHALVATLGLWLGTLALPFGNMLFSHAAVMALLAIALAAILLPVPTAARRHAFAAAVWRAGCWLAGGATFAAACWVLLQLMGAGPSTRFLILTLAIMGLSAPLLLGAGTWRILVGQGGSAERRRRHALVGLALGVAVACEYAAAIPAMALLILMLMRDARGAVRAACWALVPVLLIPLTNWLCFQSPFQLGYGLNQEPWVRTGFFGIRPMLNLSTMSLLLFSGSKGLLFWSPCLALALPGFLELYRRDRALCLALAGGALLLFIAIASTGNPGGGMSAGPRYLAPAIPLLAIPMALGLASLPRLGIVLVGISIVLNFIAFSVNPMPSPEMQLPLLDFYLPAILRGGFLWNWGADAGLARAVSILPLIGFAAGMIAASWKLAGTIPAKRGASD